LAHPPTVDDICRALEQAAAENSLPVEFFARVIWQESRFNASAVSPKGAEGIAQFMPRTADWHGLADPFDPIEALRHSAGYFRELRDRFSVSVATATSRKTNPRPLLRGGARLRPIPQGQKDVAPALRGSRVPQHTPCQRQCSIIQSLSAGLGLVARATIDTVQPCVASH
jgi:hypothetical protein